MPRKKEDRGEKLCGEWTSTVSTGIPQTCLKRRIRERLGDDVAIPQKIDDRLQLKRMGFIAYVPNSTIIISTKSALEHTPGRMSHYGVARILPLPAQSSSLPGAG